MPQMGDVLEGPPLSPVGYAPSDWRARSPVGIRSYASARDRSILLRKAANESKGEIDGLHDDVQSLQGAIAGHANALNVYKQQIRAKEDECRELQTDLKTVKTDNEHLRLRLNAAEEALAQMEAGRRKLIHSASTAEEDAKDKEARMRDLQVRLEGLDQELCFANQRACSADTEIAELRRRLLTADGAAEKAESRADAMSHQLDVLQQQMQDLTHVNATLERKAVEDQHQKVELQSLLQRAQGATEQLQSKCERSEATVAELRREATEMTKLKMMLGEAKRQLQNVLASKNGVNIELLRSEEALAAALQDATHAETMRGELQNVTKMYEAVAGRLQQSEGIHEEARSDLSVMLQRNEELERRASEAEKRSAALTLQMEEVALDAKVLHDNEALRRQDDAELETLRVEVQERRRECEELAMGVERLHQKSERERSKRIELEAFRDEMMALEARNVDRQKVLALTEERSVLEQQLSQVVTTLNMLWNELGPMVCIFLE